MTTFQDLAGKHDEAEFMFHRRVDRCKLGQFLDWLPEDEREALKYLIAAKSGRVVSVLIRKTANVYINAGVINQHRANICACSKQV